MSHDGQHRIRPSSEEPDHPLLDVKAVSRYLCIKPCTIYAWAEQGKIPCLKIHGLVRFDRDEIDQWIELFRKPPSDRADRPAPRRRRGTFDLESLLARVKSRAYNSAPRGSQIQSSPTRKEEQGGAL